MRRLAAAAGLLLVGAQDASPPAAPPSPEAAAIAARMAALPIERSVQEAGLYTPAEVVRGSNAPLPSAEPDARQQTALAAAQAYAAARQSFAFLVLHHGRIVAERHWAGTTPASRFSTASMHKTVLALAVGAAVAEKRLTLEDRVDRWLPEWRGDPRGRITLRQLLEMRSGLAAAPFSRSPDSYGARLQFAADIRAVALSAPLAAPAEAEFSYLNVNSQLAGAMLEAATRERYAAFLSRMIWRPIGADDAALWLDREGGSPHHFCCLQATAFDWARVGELIRLKGRAGRRQVVPASWIAAMAAPSAANPNFGLHLWRGSPFAAERRYNPTSPLIIRSAAPFAADDVLFLDGAGGQRVYVAPSRGLTIVRIGQPLPDWDDTALPNLVMQGFAPG